MHVFAVEWAKRLILVYDIIHSFTERAVMTHLSINAITQFVQPSCKKRPTLCVIGQTDEMVLHCPRN